MTNSIMHVVGARPNFPKAAPVLAALTELGVSQILVHTGQHYHELMSNTFFRELKLPDPDINLGVGSGSHARQTAAIMVGIEEAILDKRPSVVVVYGDVNSTIAAALAAVKVGIPIAHVEAGLRCFDRKMPEEINRVLTDQVAELLFTSSPEALENLTREGISPDRTHFVGNTMIDTLVSALPALDPAGVQERFGLPEQYIVATIHRPSNVDTPQAAREMVGILREVSMKVPVVIPIHPRGLKHLEAAGLATNGTIFVLEPQSYLDFISAVKGSRAVITDSGGVQEETTYLGIPCLTIRASTERPVTITHGTNRLVCPDTVLKEIDLVLGSEIRSTARILPPLWDGQAGRRIAQILKDFLDGLKG